MLGLVLEGGGARGAYEMGAVKALMENGYSFDGVVGTSIGAINAAVIAQGDWEKGIEIWSRLTPESIFNEEAQLLDVLTKSSITPKDIPEAFRDLIEIFKNGGLKTGNIRQILDEYIDEEALRKSPMEFGLVTYSVTDKRSVKVFKGDIPEGHLTDYLIASSMLPVFKQEKLDGRFFMDGGYVDVCPYNMLIERGFDELVVIRVFGTGVTRKMMGKSTQIKMIIPSERLSSLLDFSPETVSYSMKMGYYDALRIVKGYKGRKYYITEENENNFFKLLLSIDEKYRRAIGKVLGLEGLPGMRLLTDGILPVFAASLKLPMNYTYGELVISAVEAVALAKEINRFEVYSFDSLLSRVSTEVYPNPQKKFIPIDIPYRTDKGQPSVFKLPSSVSKTAYAYKMPDKAALGTALELFIKALSEISEGNL